MWAELAAYKTLQITFGHVSGRAGPEQGVGVAAVPVGNAPAVTPGAYTRRLYGQGESGTSHSPPATRRGCVKPAMTARVTWPWQPPPRMHRTGRTCSSGR